MPILSKYAAVVTLVLSGTVSGLPRDPLPQLSTHRIHHGTRDTSFSGYHPDTAFETFPQGVDSPETHRGPVDGRAVAIGFLEQKLGLKRNQIKHRTSYDAEVATHVYLKQQINGIDVANGVANVALNKAKKVIAYGSNFVKPKKVASASPSLGESMAIASAERKLDGKYNNFPVRLEYLLTDKDHAVLTHVVQVENSGHWYEAFVDAHSGEVVNVIDFVADAAYNVVPFQNQDPSIGGFSLITDPADAIASPNGWHTVGSNNYTTTQGNNVVAYKGNEATGQTSQSGEGLVFDYTWNPATDPTAGSNLDVARVNAFYMINTMHDLTYKYGFTEKAFNFQKDNFNKGGAGNDHVKIYVHAPGSNNANFATPPDGQSGRCNMFLWTMTTPKRDGDLSNDIIVHEMMHGVTNRMTGGGSGRCLQTTESGGMGEGWGDAMGFATQQQNATIKDFTLGGWVLNDPKGIRTVPYSTNKEVNKHMYSTLKTLNQVHRIGEVWATMLFELFAGLIEKDGFSADIFNTELTTGNIKWFHLIIDALAIQPCNPTFINARDAIVQADVNRYAEGNKCTIWKAFAKRGLGMNAAKYVDNMDVPEGC